jgi:hypothetical protein
MSGKTERRGRPSPKKRSSRFWKEETDCRQYVPRWWDVRLKLWEHMIL